MTPLPTTGKDTALWGLIGLFGLFNALKLATTRQLRRSAQPVG